MEEVTGYIVGIRYYNAGNHYCVAQLLIDDGNETKITLTGYFKPPERYDLYCYSGDFIDHPRFGNQFQVKAYRRVDPTGREATIRFLSSNRFRGIGQVTATALFDTFGPEILKLIRDDPSILEETPFTAAVKQSLVEGLTTTDCLEQAVQLFGGGLSLRDIMKLEARNGEKMIEQLLANPYLVIGEVDSISFQAADKIALSHGLTDDSPERVLAAIKTAIRDICHERGDTYCSELALRSRFTKLTQLNDDYFYAGLAEAINYGYLLYEDERYYPIDLYQAEEGIAQMLTPFIVRQEQIQESYLSDFLEESGRNEGIIYSPEQIMAAVAAFSNGVSIITGGPGTGKTTIVKAICKLAQHLHPDQKLVLTAPTGRAAKRLSELTGRQATTIHRALGWDLHSDRFARNAFAPLEGDFLIIDEFSMVDTELFYNLMLAIPKFQRILIIGDSEQLPSVSPGNMLSDLIETEMIHFTQLSTIYRQAEGSGIVRLANHIRNRDLEEDYLADSDIYFFQLPADQTKDKIVELVKRHIAKNGNDLDLQVIVPMYFGVAGIDNLNRLIRDLFNPADPNKAELEVFARVFRVGDKVLQCKNQPDDDVYNGDIGIIKQIVHAGKDGANKDIIVAQFDDKLVTYDAYTFRHLTHAYAISVHKSQGSEYPLVIFPITREHTGNLRRRLIYTAITRAKNHLVIIGDYQTMANGVFRRNEYARLTSLIERIRMNVKKESI